MLFSLVVFSVLVLSTPGVGQESSSGSRAEWWLQAEAGGGVATHPLGSSLH